VFPFNISENVTNFVENFCTNIFLVHNCFVIVRSKLWLIAFLKIFSCSDYFGGHKIKFSFQCPLYILYERQTGPEFVKLNFIFVNILTVRFSQCLLKSDISVAGIH
jgi:hypothetical protein